MLKNEMLPKIQAEKNTQALEEAQAKLKQLKTTYDLKRSAAEADLRILQIRRDRAENAMRQAESNADRMAIQSPIGGMAVLSSIWKSNNMAEVQEGEEVRSGMPIVDVVNPASMRVRAKVNQADIDELKAGLPVRDRPRRVSRPLVHRPGRADFAAGRHVRAVAEGAQLHRADRRRRLPSQPDAGPHGVARRRARAQPRALVVPRDALRFDGEQVYVRVQRGGGFADQTGDGRSDERPRSGRHLRPHRRRGHRTQRDANRGAPDERAASAR